jgi:SRSO17 transposase
MRWGPALARPAQPSLVAYCGTSHRSGDEHTVCQALVSLTLARDEVPVPVGLRLLWAVGIPRNQKACGADVRLVPPAGRKRKPVPDEEPRAAEEVLAGLPWRRVTWRRGTKGALAARFAAIRVRVGDGASWGNNRHLPGEEAWLAGERRPIGERKCHLSNLPPRTSLRALAGAIKARWVCEQAHQQLKQEPGLGHFEGRSWTGLHRHALMTCIAFAYLQHLRLAGRRSTGQGKMPRRDPGPPPTPSLPAVRRAVIARLFAHPAAPARCPRCGHRFRPAAQPGQAMPSGGPPPVPS